MVVDAVSVPAAKATPVPVSVKFPPSPANPTPVTVTEPVEPAPMVLPAPEGVNTAEVIAGVAAALAAVAIANGSAAAASKAPAASALTKWRCIRRGLFMVNSLHS